MYSVLNVNSLLKIVQILISFNFWYYKFSLILNNFWSLSVAIKLFYFGFLACLHFGTCICSYYTYTYEKYNKQTYLANSSIQPRFSLLLWLKWARFERTNWVYCYELPNYESTMYKSKSKGYVSRSKNSAFPHLRSKMVFFDEMVFDAFVSSKTEQKSDGQLSAKSSLIFRMLLHFLFVSITAKKVRFQGKIIHHCNLQVTRPLVYIL